MTTLSRILLASVALPIAAASGPANAGGLVQPAYHPGNFDAPLVIDNRFWPLVPGRHIVYFEMSDDECIVNHFRVTSDVKDDFTNAYAGLQARVVADQEWLDEDCDGTGEVLLEDTFDWYAQDNAGNVWYFGEDTTEYLFDDEGNPAGSSTAGSWEAGVDGAIAGLIMLARPAPGLFYRQEFYAGQAEDRAKIVGLDRNVSIGLGDFPGCLVTKEWTPLSPGAVERKSYCPDVGLVLVEELGGRTVVVEPIDLGL